MTSKWVDKVLYNGEPLWCKDPSCSQRWFVDADSGDGHCECHETEFFVGANGVLVVVTLGSVI